MERMLDKKVERISLCVLGLDDMSDGKQQNENILKKNVFRETHFESEAWKRVWQNLTVCNN